jgi:hypothetical protein
MGTTWLISPRFLNSKLSGAQIDDKIDVFNDRNQMGDGRSPPTQRCTRRSAELKMPDDDLSGINVRFAGGRCCFASCRGKGGFKS